MPSCFLVIVSQRTSVKVYDPDIFNCFGHRCPLQSIPPAESEDGSNKGQRCLATRADAGATNQSLVKELGASCVQLTEAECFATPFFRGDGDSP